MPDETKNYMDERQMITGFKAEDESGKPKDETKTGDPTKAAGGGDKKPDAKTDDGVQEQLKAIQSRMDNRDSQTKRLETQMQEILQAVKSTAKPMPDDDDDDDDAAAAAASAAKGKKIPEGFETIQAALKQQETAILKRLAPVIDQVQNLSIREGITALKEDPAVAEAIKGLPDDVRKTLTSRVAKFVANYEPEAGENPVEEAVRFLIHRHSRSATTDTKTDFLPEGGQRADSVSSDANRKANEEVFGVRLDKTAKVETAKFIDAR